MYEIIHSFREKPESKHPYLKSIEYKNALMLLKKIMNLDYLGILIILNIFLYMTLLIYIYIYIIDSNN